MLSFVGGLKSEIVISTCIVNCMDASSLSCMVTGLLNACCAYQWLRVTVSVRVDHLNAVEITSNE